MSEDVEVMRALVRHRLASGMTQAEVAARMGISPSSLCTLETGRRTVRGDTMQRYARALGVRLTFVPLENEASRN